MKKSALDFAKVLRTALRQDPDIIMIGEIRDHETATIAIRAALTGHLVLASLHTNDAASTATRLVDMGVEGYLVSAALRAVLAQRLVRKICSRCREPSALSDSEYEFMAAIDNQVSKETTFYKGKGCAYCNQTGFSGRIGVFELLILNQIMINALNDKDPSIFRHMAMDNKHYQILSKNALQLAIKGETTLNEVLRIVGEFKE